MRVFYLIIASLFSIISHSQITTSQNYIKKSFYEEPVKIWEDDSSTKVTEVVNYLDGKGKTLQTTLLQNGGEYEDINYSFAYDPLNRQSKKFLAYPSKQAGAYIANYNSELTSYYNSAKYEYTENPYEETVYDVSLYKPGQIAHPGNKFAVAETHTVKYGYHYNLATDNIRNYFIAYTDLTNPSDPVLDQNGTYATKSLSKKIIKSENWLPTNNKNKTTEYYTDALGRKILKRVYNQGVAYDTYYVYDVHDNLTFVIPPMAENILQISIPEKYLYQYRYDHKNRLVEKKLPGSGWIYILYDALNRPILTQDAVQRAKPESPWNFIRYDIYGRVAFSGTLNAVGYTRQTLQSLADSWNLYESRQTAPLPIAGGVMYYTNTVTLPVFPEIIKYYDDYAFDLDGLTIPTTSYYGQSLTAKTKSLVTGTKFLVTDGTGTAKWITAIVGYDKKQRPIYNASKNQYTAAIDVVETQLDFVGKVMQTKTVHNKTGTITNLTTFDYYYYDQASRLLRHSQKIGNEPVENILVRKYDELGTLVQEKTGGKQKLVITGITATNNILTKNGTISWVNGTVEAGSMPKSGFFTFKVLNPTSGIVFGLTTTAPASTTYLQMNYSLYLTASPHPDGGSSVTVYESGVDRGVKTNYYPNDQFTIERVGNVLHYKKNGKVFYTSSVYSLAVLYGDVHLFSSVSPIADLQLHNAFEQTNDLQTSDYKYDVQGRLTKINDINDLGKDLFAFEIKRENPLSGTPLYNNNISQTFWKTANSPTVLRNYTYTYDDIDQYKGAAYSRKENITTRNGGYNEEVEYDKNGNITGLYRFGLNETTPVNIDKLTYLYNGNQVTKITDAYTGAEGFIDGANLTTEYAYDSNGNMTRDSNKGITSITYDSNNMPLQVTFSGTNKFIKYVYAADGTKLSKEVSNGSNVTTTLYAGNYRYEKVNSGVFELKYFSNESGYVAYNAGIIAYVYQYKDHLQNIRLSYSDADKNGTVALTEIIDENNYYPLGMTHKGYNNNYNNVGSAAYKHKFNGQEWQDELGLNLTAMDYRQYDNAIGRFTTIDPLAESDFDISPYAFARNSPIALNDPTGLSPDAWEQYEVNDEIDQNLYLDRAPGVFGQTVSEYDMVTGTPMGGGQLRDVSINNDYREAYDRHGRIDNDTDHGDGLYDEDGLGRAIVGLVPLLGGALDIYEGIKNGNALQTTIGVASLTADVFTLGSASILIGSAKMGARAGVKAGAKEALKEGAEEVVESGIVEGIKELGEEGVFIVTKEGVVLPKGAKIPENFIENAHRSSNYGVLENGKYVEKVRIDAGTPPGSKGPNESHFHLNDGNHIFDANKWPWW